MSSSRIEVDYGRENGSFCRNSGLALQRKMPKPTLFDAVDSTTYWGYQKKILQIWYYPLDSGSFRLVFAHYEFCFLSKWKVEKESA
jgi:hypothetical protein